MTFRAAAVLRNCSRCCSNVRSPWKYPSARLTLRRQDAAVQYRQFSRSVPSRSEHSATEEAEQPKTADREATPSDSDANESTEIKRGEAEEPAQRLVELQELDLEQDFSESSEAADILRSYLGKPAAGKVEDDPMDVQPPANGFASQGSGGDQPPSPKSYRGFSDSLLTQPEIGVDALGQPIGALMLRNPNMIRLMPRYSEVPILERDEPIKPFEIQDGIETERNRTPLSQTELFRNIEEQRPSDRSVISTYEFGKILDALVDGFTYDQLQAYRKQKTLETRSSAPLSQHKWIHTQTGWASAVPTRMLGKGSAKARHAWHIMTRCWGLASQDQVDAVGTNTIFMRPEVEWLFKRSNSPALEIIRQDYLDETNGESVHQYFSTVKNRRAVHLESKRSTMNTVLEKLDSMITSIVSRTIQGYGHILTRDVANPANLELLGELTNTKIETQGAEGKKTLKVHWVPSVTRPAPGKEDSIATKHEDPADVALRLLINAREEQTRPADELDIFRPQSEENIATIPYSRQSRGKPIMHQFVAHYSRPSISIPRRANTSVAQNPFDTPEKMAKLTQHFDLTARKFTSSRAYVTFGHVLELGDQIKTKFAQINQAQGAEWGSVKSRRDFLPWAPHPAALTSTTADIDSSDIKRSTAIVLNYRKDPSLKKAGYRSLLPIQITIPVDPTDMSEVIKITDEAIIEAYNSKQHDMCFSNQPVDARLVTDQRYRIERTKDVQDLMDACTISLADGYLGIPSRAVFSQPATKKMPNRGSAEYIYTGLEIRQSVEIPWKGHLLRYNSVEGGLAGGQRQEVILETDLTPATAGDERGHRLSSEEILAQRTKDLQGLLDLTTEVADGRHFSWVNGKKEMGVWTPRLDKHENQESAHAGPVDVDTATVAAPAVDVNQQQDHPARPDEFSDMYRTNLISRLVYEDPTLGSLEKYPIDDSLGSESSISNEPDPRPEIDGMDAMNQILGESQEPSAPSITTDEFRSLTEKARLNEVAPPAWATTPRTANSSCRQGGHTQRSGRGGRGSNGSKGKRGGKPLRKPALDPKDPFSAVIGGRRR